MRVFTLLLAVLLVVGTAGTHEAGAQDGPRRTPIGEWDPLPPSNAVEVSDEATALRDELLGEHWDDPRHVTLHWTGVSSFVVTIGGHLLLFDAWEIIGAVTDYLPLGREELAALEPEAVLVGHGHFDHAGDLGYVAGRSGAAVVGSDEICDVAVAGATREGVGTDFACAITGTADDPPPGTARPFRLFADVAPVTVLQHVHSAATPPSEDNELDPFLPIMDHEPYLEHFADDPAELARFLGQQAEQDQGGTWMYHLADGEFTLLLGDSAGPIFDHPAVGEALASMPGCVDVLANAILGFDQPVSGLQDPVLYVAATQPRVFVPTHADAWAPVISAGQAQYEDALLAEMAEQDVDAEVDLLVDPDDYLVERAYRVDDPQWVDGADGTHCAVGHAEAPGPSAGGSRAEHSATPRRGLPATGGGLGLLALAVLALASVRRP